MYRVINQGKVVASFVFFFDAWLCAIDFPVYSRIVHPDGINVVVNPKITN